MRHLGMATALCLATTGLVGCGVGVQSGEEVAGSTVSAEEACTVLCAIGFHRHPKVCVCLPDAPQPCGDRHCGRNQVCCNASCGICTEPDEGCIQIACLPKPHGNGVPCGNSFCAPGDVCCNDSCGICTPPGGVCIQIFCG